LQQSVMLDNTTVMSCKCIANYL